jgi:hypothetical protein
MNAAPEAVVALHDADLYRDAPQGDDDLAEMNEKYAVVKVGGATKVMSLQNSSLFAGCMTPEFSSVRDFCLFHLKRKKVIRDNRGNEKKIGIGTWWIQQDDRRQYDGITYAPNIDSHGMFNLWRGFSCEPRKGNCDLYIELLRDGICKGVIPHYEYLLNWQAYGIQRPGRPGQTAIVMRGREGTGKGVAAKGYGRLFGSHFLHVTNPKHLTGHFNAHLLHCSALFADESFFAGDRQHENILKTLITEETLLIEPKGVNPFQVRNCIHLMMASNSDWVVPAGADARRFFVVDVADTHMQDHPYFAAINDQLDKGGREALLYELLNRDLSGFNVRQVPQTAALAEQKAFTRRGLDRLIELVAHAGSLPSAHWVYPDIAVTSGEDQSRGFYCQARTLVPDLKYVGSSVVISNKLKDDWQCTPWHSGNVRGLKFPKLSELRHLFDRRHGPQRWPEDTNEWEAPVDWRNLPSSNWSAAFER